MIIKDVTSYLESLAPLQTQASFDNCGLIVGDDSNEVTGIISCLDCMEEVVDEAIRKGCNLIIAHHPIVFKGLKKITGKNYIERTIIKAIQHNISIYAIHTNLDHYRFGVNYEIGQRLGLINLQILDPVQGTLLKLICHVPEENKEIVLNAMFNAGAGEIGNYSECSFENKGIGKYTPNEFSNPHDGEIGKKSIVNEFKIEVLVPEFAIQKVIADMKRVHPYEEVAYDIIRLENKNQFEGSGMVGELKSPEDEKQFLQIVKEVFKCGVIRHTNLLNKKISKVAFCGGSGSFLLSKAKQVGADIFITGDYKYHDFFDAENQIVIADIGHFESEQYTINLIADILMKKFPTFVVHLTEVNTNPINYF